MPTVITCSKCNDQFEVPGTKNSCSCGNTTIITDNNLIRVRYNTDTPPSHKIYNDEQSS